MPPQQTDPASESGSDAAVLGLDLTLALVKEATRDALPEKNAARPMSSPTRNVLGLLKRYWCAFGEWQRQRSQTTLHELSDRALMDIGVTRAEIDHIAAHRVIDALRDSIHSRGVM
jgi:uncharacterized protein YjiS (DUF1127 family)